MAIKYLQTDVANKKAHKMEEKQQQDVYGFKDIKGKSFSYTFSSV